MAFAPAQGGAWRRAHNEKVGWSIGVGVMRRDMTGTASTAAANPLKEKRQVNFDKELDARGLSCPLPILKTKKSLNELTSGQVLKVVATDPGSVKDMEAFANQTGNPLLSAGEENKDFVFYLRKK